MRELDRDIENAFIHDFEDDIEDNPIQQPKEIVPKPAPSLSSIQPRKQRSPWKGTRWPPEDNALLIRLRATGMGIRRDIEEATWA